MFSISLVNRGPSTKLWNDFLVKAEFGMEENGFTGFDIGHAYENLAVKTTGQKELGLRCPVVGGRQNMMPRFSASPPWY
jgi:hypothetical protein